MEEILNQSETITNQFCSRMKTLLPLSAVCFLEPANVLCADTPKKPNVIVILTDDQGYGDIAALGNPVIRTPHLDRLHRGAML